MADRDADSTVVNGEAQGVLPVVPGSTPRGSGSGPEKKPKRKLGRWLVVLLVAAIAAIAVAACVLLSGSWDAVDGEIESTEEEEDLGYELTGGVAATVNGEELLEDDVTIYIMTLRAASGYDTDEAWAAYLEEVGLTPAEYRENVIERFATQALVLQAAEGYGLSVTEEEVEAAWTEAAAAYGSEDAFIDALGELGYTETTYRAAIVATMLAEELEDYVAAQAEIEIDDAAVLTYFKENFYTYNGARRSAHILFAVEEDATEAEVSEVEDEAQEVLALIQSGTLSFEEAVAACSDDADTVDAAGDMGWDKLVTLPAAYQEALASLSVGGLALVQLSDGFHLIQCTDYYYTTSSAVAFEDIPTEMVEFVRTRLETEAASEAYATWLSEYTAAAEIEIYEMPATVPYNTEAQEEDSGE